MSVGGASWTQWGHRNKTVQGNLLGFQNWRCDSFLLSKGRKVSTSTEKRPSALKLRTCSCLWPSQLAWCSPLKGNLRMNFCFPLCNPKERFLLLLLCWDLYKIYPPLAVNLRKKAPRKPMVGWGDGSGDKAFAAWKHEDQSSGP